MMRKTMLIFAALALVTTVAAGQAQAHEFYVVIANLTNESSPHAQVDVSVDTRVAPGAAINVLFNVYGADGVELSSFEVLTNPNGFASSASAAPANDNLFAVSQGLPALVRVRTPQVAPTGAVVLRQTLKRDLKRDEIVFGVPATTRSDGTRLAMGRVFSVAIGDIGPGATLLIANVSGTDQIVDVVLGTTTGPGNGKYTNPRLTNRSIWIVDLDETDANSHLIVSSGGDIVVQLAVDDAKKGITEGPVLPH